MNRYIVYDTGTGFYKIVDTLTSKEYGCFTNEKTTMELTRLLNNYEELLSELETSITLKHDDLQHTLNRITSKIVEPVGLPPSMIREYHNLDSHYVSVLRLLDRLKYKIEKKKPI